MSIINQNLPKNKIWFPEGLSNILSRLESTFELPNDDLILLKRLPGYKKHSSERIANILNSGNLITEQYSYLLLQICGRILVDHNFSARSELCDQVWKKLEEGKINFNMHHYNIYLQNCIDNRKQINFREFLGSMKCEPNEETLRLLLQCSCENGDIEQALQILQQMQNRRYTFDDSQIFNTLLMGYAVSGGFSSAKLYLTRRKRDVNITPETYFKLLLGLALYNSEQDFVSSLMRFKIKLKDHNYLDLLLRLGSKGNHTWLTRIETISGSWYMSNEDIKQLTLLCRQLIYLNQSESAIFYYTWFVPRPQQDDEKYGVTLLKHMVYSKTPVEKIIELICSLKNYNVNSSALEKLINVALMNDTELAWKLLEKFTVLRTPANFKPILVESGQKQGELGILSTLKKMMEWGVRPECETLELYCIPFYSSNNYQDLYSRMLGLGFTNSELFPSFWRFFFKQNYVSACLEICRNNRAVGGVLVNEYLISLSKTWINTKDTENITEILQYTSEVAKNPFVYFGNFLCRTLPLCQTLSDYQHFYYLLTVMKRKNMVISSKSVRSLMEIMYNLKDQYPLIEDIKRDINQLSYASLGEVQPRFSHPLYNMNLPELESHLIQLRYENLETRDVLLLLVRRYCNLGNEEKVRELRQEFQYSGYQEIPGMKSYLMSLYILKENVNNALETYKELQSYRLQFMVDVSKIIDLAALLVKKNQFDVALNILEDETKKRKAIGAKLLVRNCGRLLESANNELEIQTLYHFLITNGYCRICTVELEPLVKFYITRDNLIKAVETFKDCVNKYKCTPQQLELLDQVVKMQNKELTKEVYNCLVEVHGSKNARVLRMVALAQNGCTDGLKEVLKECKLNNKIRVIENKCKQWRNANNLKALETLYEATWEVPFTDVINRNTFYNIMKLHNKNDDCESALKFYEKLVKRNTIISLWLFTVVLQITIRCKYKMPVTD